MATRTPGRSSSWCLENSRCFFLSINVGFLYITRWCMQDFWTSNSRVLILICFWHVKTFPSSSSSHLEHPPKVAKYIQDLLALQKSTSFFFQNHVTSTWHLFLNGTFLMWASPAVCKSRRFSRFFSAPRFWLAGDLHAGQFGRAPERHRAAEEVQRRWEVLSLSSSWWIFLQGKLPPGI